ncbi:MAG: hypothetical protein JSS51_09680 [Planctomycetes bacterium]|nr:hypothetical protein [Planctomycetota bacterium]
MNIHPRVQRAFFVLALASLATGASAAVTVAAGPFYNATTRSRYYRIEGGDWNQLRAFALQMGGDLATIDDAAENTWVRANIVGNNTKPFIGLNDATTEGTFAWVDGSSSSYRNWAGGAPSNNSSSRDFVRYDGQAGGTWEVVTVAFSNDAIVEIKPINGVQAPIRVPSEQPTLVGAIDAIIATGANQVDVAAGTYALPGPFSFGNTQVRGAGIGATVFQGPVSGNAFYLTGTGSVRDCTIVNRSTSPSIIMNSGTPQLIHVELTSLPGTADAELVQVLSSGGVATIDGCLFNTSEFAIRMYDGDANITNSVFRDLGAITKLGYSFTNAKFSNCVFTRCGPTQLFDSSSQVSVSNSIFWDNSGDFGSPLVSYSIAPAAFGPTNLNSDPKFVNAAANDFRLQPGSPCIDRGSIAAFIACQPPDLTDAAGNFRVIDAPTVPNLNSPVSPLDLGAYEWVPAACPGDLNGDGMVADDDFTIFLVGYNQLLCP